MIVNQDKGEEKRGSTLSLSTKKSLATSTPFKSKDKPSYLKKSNKTDQGGKTGQKRTKFSETISAITTKSSVFGSTVNKSLQVLNYLYFANPKISKICKSENIKLTTELFKGFFEQQANLFVEVLARILRHLNLKKSGLQALHARLEEEIDAALAEMDGGSTSGRGIEEMEGSVEANELKSTSLNVGGSFTSEKVIKTHQGENDSALGLAKLSEELNVASDDISNTSVRSGKPKRQGYEFSIENLNLGLNIDGKAKGSLEARFYAFLEVCVRFGSNSLLFVLYFKLGLVLID